MRSRQLPLGRACTIVVVSLVVLALTLMAGCRSTSKTAPPSIVVQAPAAQPASEGASGGETEAPTPKADPRQLDLLDADLVRAIATAEPSLSPDALDTHIRSVTYAPYSMIVAPYDPKAQSDSVEFGKTWVAGYGTDAAITTEFQGIIYASRGKPCRDFDPGLIDEPLYFAGRPVRVGGLPGYVLVARTAR